MVLMSPETDSYNCHKTMLVTVTKHTVDSASYVQHAIYLDMISHMISYPKVTNLIPIKI